MPLVDIGKVVMAVPDGSMRADVLIVQRAVLIFMRVVFCQMQPDTYGHQQRRDPELGTDGLTQHQ